MPDFAGTYLKAQQAKNYLTQQQQAPIKAAREKAEFESSQKTAEQARQTSKAKTYLSLITAPNYESVEAIGRINPDMDIPTKDQWTGNNITLPVGEFELTGPKKYMEEGFQNYIKNPDMFSEKPHPAGGRWVDHSRAWMGAKGISAKAIKDIAPPATTIAAWNRQHPRATDAERLAFEKKLAGAKGTGKETTAEKIASKQAQIQAGVMQDPNKVEPAYTEKQAEDALWALDKYEENLEATGGIGGQWLQTYRETDPEGAAKFLGRDKTEIKREIALRRKYLKQFTKRPKETSSNLIYQGGRILKSSGSE